MEDFYEDEISQLYAEADMKEVDKQWALDQAHKFYDDFTSVDTPSAIKNIKKLILDSELVEDEVIESLDNMIKIFEEIEDYEKCGVCLEIKNGVRNEFV